MLTFIDNEQIKGCQVSLLATQSVFPWLENYTYGNPPIYFYPDGKKPG